MPIRINCPACDTPNNVADDKRGGKIRCAKCKKPFSVPEASGKKKRPPDVAVQEGRKVKSVTARKREDEDEGDEPRNRPAKPKKKEPARGGGSAMMLAVGGVAVLLLFCLLGVGGIGAFFVFRAKPDDKQLAKVVEKNDLEKKDNPEKKDSEKKDNPNRNDPERKEPERKESDRKEPERKEPEKKDNLVEKKKDPVIDPGVGKVLPTQMTQELVGKVKQATVYLHVTMPSGVTAEGSGFFAMERGIIVTNAHVLGMLLATSKAPKQVDVVQDSGLLTETKMVGEVLGVDRVSDLAVVRVPDNGKLPTPLTLSDDAPAELQKIYIFGFPFGEKLGKNITISEQSITSLRPDKTGSLEQIQVNGGMNPGNSGGPVVNTRGNLVGVSVSIISGAQISFAVPAEKVRRIMEGRITDHHHGEAYVHEGKTHMPVRLACLDPLNQIRELRLEVWTGPAGAVRPMGSQKPQAQPGDGPRQEHTVKFADGTGALDVPLPALPGGHVYWVQPVLTTAKGTHWGAAQPTDADFAVVERKPANLTIDLEKQKERTTRLNSRLTVTETFGKTETKQVIQALAETLEVLQEPGEKNGRKNATIRTAYGPVNVGVTINGKAVKFGKEELDAMALVRGMPPTFIIDDTNATVSFITVSLNPKNPKYHLKDLVQTLNGLVQNPYEATQFKMPNRVVQPQESFPSQSTMAMRIGGQQGQPKTKGPAKGAPPPPPPPNIVDLKMNLTFQGVRIRNGREEAVLTVVGTLQSRKIKGRSLGDITGKIGFDIAGGFVSSATLKIFAESEESIPGLGTFRDSLSQDIELDRAAGNLKNLALRVDPPPANKDPLPGKDSGNGGVTKIVGGAFDPQFTDQAPDGGLLIGLEVGLSKFGANDVVKAIRPIYRTAKDEEVMGMPQGKNFSRIATVKAKPGYAIGGLTVNAGLGIDGFTATFMRVNGGKLDPKDSYQSDYIGGKGGSPSVLGGDGTSVIGVIGKSNQNDCTGIGLLLKVDVKDAVAGGVVGNPAPVEFFNGDVTLRHLSFTKSGPIADDIVWAKDGKSFYMLHDNGLLQQINIASGQTEQFLEIGVKCTALAMCGEGLLVGVNGLGQLWVIDPDKLGNVKKKIAVPGIYRVSSGLDASLVWAGFPNPSGRGIALKAVDVKEGTVLKTHSKFEIWVFAASPDGKYVCIANDNGLARYRVERDDLIYEDASYRIGGNNTRRICFSPDSKFVSMPAGGGNGGGHKDHPPLKNYATYIYPINNLKSPVTGYAAGGFPRAVGIDTRSNLILAQNNGKPLIVYSFAADSKIAEYDFKLLQRTTTTEFSFSPVGSEAIARTENHGIVHIKINKAGPPIKIGLNEGVPRDQMALDGEPAERERTLDRSRQAAGNN